ncbi:hypothetical protein [Cohnella terricola]|uniref:DUF5640 domain-containing protein n=1 Tax=Cohnella terricola TaxID=1289167 RepID=A0A559J8W7_9BACL|nr:hypothetical protein [Cohnella terricola]TVX96297.1 hypothetical protein FPZ45_21575 [Cohnella terricola]
MSKLRALFMFIGILFAISGCTQKNEDLIIGNWVGDQASQKFGVIEELSQYNYLEITNTEVIIKNFVYLMQDNKMVMEFSDGEKQMKYELINKNHITINNKRYTIDLKKNEMTIKNENVELHYKKEGK